MLLHPWVASHPGSLPMATCFGKGHYHPLLMSEAHASHLLVAVMAPYHISSSLGVTSHGIAPMTPHSCTRHCAHVHNILNHALSRLCCWYILMLHPSNRPWGIEPMTLQVVPHKALLPYATVKRGVHITPYVVVITGCTPPHVMEPMCGCQQGLPYVLCLCWRPYIEAPWCGHAHATLGHLHPLPSLFGLF